VRYAGDSYDDAAHTHLLKSYALVDLRASYPLADALEAYGRLENLFNKRYETAYQYGTLGFGAYAGLRAHF
jgi:vitamin B12 transporter